MAAWKAKAQLDVLRDACNEATGLDNARLQLVYCAIEVAVRWRRRSPPMWKWGNR